MQHTLVAVFDNRSDAQNALDELVSSGFSRSDVNLSSADPTGQTDSLTGATDTLDTPHEEGIGASIKHFFTGLFGSDNDAHVSKYSDAVTRGHHVVTLTTTSEPEVERAADIIERFGPVDIDERHDLTAAQAMAGGAASSGMYAGTSSSSGAALGQSMQSGSIQSAPSMGAATIDTRQGALQTTSNESPGYFGTQNLNDAIPEGTTYEEPSGTSRQSRDPLSSAMGSTERGGVPSTPQSGSAGIQQAAPGNSGLSQSSATLQGTASIPGSDDASLGGTALTSDGSFQGGSLYGSQQRDTSGTGLGATPRSGVRVYSRGLDTANTGDQSVSLRTPDTSAVADDGLFRNDFDQNYASLGGTYDDYAPAYKYGSESRGKYSGKQWDDVESDLRSDWDTRYNKSGEPSSWEKFKAAVRHGWDKITPDMDDEDSHYRNHWTNTYGTTGDTYNDYEPAYKYGSAARSNDKYRGREWNDVESDLRSDWDTRNGASGVSTWDKMKDAVRKGWDRVTS